MKPVARNLGIVILALVVAKCGLLTTNPKEPELTADDFPEPIIRTDRQSYTLDTTYHEVSLHITAAIGNPTEHTVYLRNCGMSHELKSLYKKEQSGWVQVWGPVCPLVARRPTQLEPGEPFFDRAILEGSIRPNTEPRFEMDSASGVYRLEYQLYTSWDEDAGFGGLLPLEGRISNEFTIE